MKKSHLLIPVFLLLFASCQEQPDTDKPFSNIVDVDGDRLRFTNEDSFVKFYEMIEKGEVQIENNRIALLPYVSFKSAQQKENVNNTSDAIQDGVLNVDTYALIANQNKEFQIGEEIYRVEGNEIKVFNRDFKLLRTHKDIVTSIEPENAEGRVSVINPYSSTPYLNINPALNKYVYYRFTAVKVFYFAYYYLEVQAKNYSFLPEQAEYIKFVHSYCIRCFDTPGLPTYKYNVSSATYLLGYETYSFFQTYGVSLTAEFAVGFKGLGETPTILHSARL